MDNCKEVFEIYIDTGASSHSYETLHPDILCNVRRGNEGMIFFETTKGEKVAIPTRFLVTQKLKLNDDVKF